MGTKQTIVVVDSDQTILTMIDNLLTETGFQTVSCHGSVGAQDLIRRKQPQLVILNTWLDSRPAGWRLLEQLRWDPTTSAIPVIVTSTDTSSLRENASLLQEESTYALEMPFDLDVLLATIRRALYGPTRIESPNLVSRRESARSVRRRSMPSPHWRHRYIVDTATRNGTGVTDD